MQNIRVIDVTPELLEQEHITVSCCGEVIKFNVEAVKHTLFDLKRTVQTKCDTCDTIIMLRWLSPLERLAVRVNSE